MKIELKRFIAVAAAGILWLVLAPQAHATLELKLMNGSCAIAKNCVTIIDTSNTGLASFNGSVGKFSVNVSTALGQNVPPGLDLNSIDKTTVGGTPGSGTLTMMATFTDYSPKASSVTFAAGGTIDKGGTITFAAYGGTSNTAFDIAGNQFGTTKSFTAPNLKTSSPSMAFCFGGVTCASPAITYNFAPYSVAPYSLTIVSTINFGKLTGKGSFNASLDATPVPVPEPGVVSMMGGILLVTVGAIRRKARRAPLS